MARRGDVQTARAVAANRALAQTSQRSREFLVEQHELQQLPPSAVIVSYASPAGRRVVLADANPGILGLPTATLDTLDEVVRAGRESAGPRGGAHVPRSAAAAAAGRVPGGWAPRGGGYGPVAGDRLAPDLEPLPDPLPWPRDGS